MSQDIDMEILETTQQTSCVKDEHVSLEVGEFNIQYGCRIIFKTAKEKNEVRYKLNIQLIEKYQGEYIFLINRLDEFYINDQVPTDASDMCAFTSNQFIFPMMISTDQSGKFMAVENFEEICQRWPEHKKGLEEKFDEKILNRSANSVERLMSSKDRFEEIIKKDWFLTLYFSAIYRSYAGQDSRNISWSYPIVTKAKPVGYDLNATLEERKSHYRINFDGTIDDERSAMDLEQSLSYPYYALTKDNARAMDGTCRIVYLVNRQQGIIHGYDAKFETAFEIPMEIQASMFRIQDVVDREGEFEGVQAAPKKKGFFASLFGSKS